MKLYKLYLPKVVKEWRRIRVGEDEEKGWRHKQAIQKQIKHQRIVFPFFPWNLPYLSSRLSAFPRWTLCSVHTHLSGHPGSLPFWTPSMLCICEYKHGLGLLNGSKALPYFVSLQSSEVTFWCVCICSSTNLYVYGFLKIDILMNSLENFCLWRHEALLSSFISSTEASVLKKHAA